MKTPTKTPITRASLLTTASCNNRWFASLLASTAVLGSAALADNWDGDVSSDWNNNNNWPGNDGNAGNATVNIVGNGVTTFTATVSADATQPVVDLFVGTGIGVTGRMDHTAGTAGTGLGNWMFVGRAGGTGTYNLADTAVAVPTGVDGPFTGYGQGTGTLNVGAAGPGGRLYIGGNNGTASNGTFNMNTTGTLWVRNQMEIGTNASVGVLNLDNGTINTGSTGGDDDWFEIGNGTGCTGTIKISGGTINKTAAGTQHFIVGANGSTGLLKQTGGTVNVNSEFWVGNNAGSNGTYNFSAGTINVSSWVAIGRGAANATGTVNMTGGTWNKTGATQFIVGANGSGTMNMSGGLVDVQGGGYTWVGEAANATTGVLTISGTAEFRTPTIGVGQSTPLAVTPALGAILNLDGGTLRTLRINGARGQDDLGAQGGIGTVNFNGTQIIASGTNTINFISNTLDNGIIGNTGGTGATGGLRVDTNGFDLTAPKLLSGPGGVVKSGAGTLTLSGANSYLGDNTVNAGTLVISSPGSGNHAVNAGSLVLAAAGAGTGSIAIADGTTLGVTAQVTAAQLTASAVTLGNTIAAATLNLNRGDVAGVNPTTALLNVTGALTVNGTITLNIAGAKFAVGEIPLISYNTANLSGGGSFVTTPGSLPSGVVATVQVDPDYFGIGLGAVYLDITSVALPEWDGTNEVVLAKSGDTVTGSADVTVLNATGIALGQTVRGAGIPTGAVVTAINGLVITLDQAATATATFVDLDFVVTAGTNEGLWDTTTQNWIDQVTTLSSLYADPNPALFSDLATGPSAVVLNSTVNPSEVTFNNSTLVYSLSGTGDISGSTGLVKQGSAGLTLATNNTYDGITSLQGGVTSIATFEDGGVASPIGDSSAAPANLVLAGGTLDYTGAADASNRGFTVAGAGSAIRNANDLTLSGQVVSTGVGAGFVKQGGGNLGFTFGGANTFGSAVFAGLNVQAGTVTFDGTAGGQTNTVAGELQLASVPDVQANLTVTNTTLNVASWLAIGRGNGDTGVTNLTVTNSTLTSGGFSSGWNNGLPNNASEAFVNVTGSTWTNTGTVNLVESLDATGTLNLVNSTWISNTGVFNMSTGANTTSTMTISGTSELRTDRFLMAHGTGSVANVIIEDSGSLNKTTGSWMSIGNSGNGVGNMTVRDSGSLTNAGGDFNISDTNTSKGFLTIEDAATVSIGGNTFVGKNTGTEGGVTQTGGTFNQNGGYLIIARFDNAVGNYNISGTGVLNQNNAGTGILVAEEGDGTLTVSGTAQVNVNGAGLFLTAQLTGFGTGVVHLNGGTITCKRVAERDNTLGNSTFHFNGGVLKAGAGVNANFMDNLNSAVVDPGGAYIDTNSQVVTIAQALDDGNGDLHKIGAGTLRLNGNSSYLGTTFVDVGTLGGTGSLSGPLVVAAGAAVNPGTSAGTFTADSADINGTYLCELDGATGDRLTVSGALTIGAGTVLDFNELAAPTALVYVIASYSTLSGTFTTVSDLPAGYSLDYNYLSGNQIALVKTLTVYQSWAAGYGLDPLTDGAAGVDKDGDGQSNGLEFALGGSPVSGSDNAKVYHLEEDSGDVGSDKELLLTIAVRSGAPAFAGSPSPTATQDGATYSVQGSTDLASFTSAVSVVAPVTTGLPAAPAGYEYRTFSLDGSNGLPLKGFLRVDVTP